VTDSNTYQTDNAASEKIEFTPNLPASDDRDYCICPICTDQSIPENLDVNQRKYVPCRDCASAQWVPWKFSPGVYQGGTAHLIDVGNISFDDITGDEQFTRFTNCWLSHLGKVLCGHDMREVPSPYFWRLPPSNP
jgi:hypothetical protein